MSETVQNNETVVETESLLQDSKSRVEDETNLVFGAPTKRRRPSKVDSFLAQAKNVALRAIGDIAEPDSIGTKHYVKNEEERLLTHYFECKLPGYRGWFWFATLSRAPRSKVATVCEVGLLPGEDSLLAPPWIPWAERMDQISEAERAELEKIKDLEEEDYETSDDDDEPADITPELEDLVEEELNE